VKKAASVGLAPSKVLYQPWGPASHYRKLLPLDQESAFLWRLGPEASNYGPKGKDPAEMDMCLQT